MADIELVVKIPEDSYKATCNGYMLPPDVKNVVQGIKNGTPLPKGHGRLIDVNDIPIDCDYYDVDTAPTIIEADKAEVEPQESEE